MMHDHDVGLPVTYPGCNVCVVVFDGVDGVVVFRCRRSFTTQLIPTTRNRHVMPASINLIYKHLYKVLLQ